MFTEKRANLFLNSIPSERTRDQDWDRRSEEAEKNVLRIELKIYVIIFFHDFWDEKPGERILDFLPSRAPSTAQKAQLRKA